MDRQIDRLTDMTKNITYPHMQVVNIALYVSVCLCFLSVRAITFDLLDIETSFLVCRYILTISRSSLSIKVKVI